MKIVPRSAQRRIQTPNAVMTTLISPTLGGVQLSVWTVRMEPGQVGPEHLFEVDQLWTIQQGGAVVELGGLDHRLREGDTAVLPANQLRRIHADGADGLTALVIACPGRVLMADGDDRGVPDWIA